MTTERLERAKEIADRLFQLDRTIDKVRSSGTDRGIRFGNESVWLSNRELDPMAAEMCKTLILTNLEGKKKQLEAEFEKL